MKKRFAPILALLLTASAQAEFYIGGDVEATLAADNVINVAAGSDVDARQNINTVHDGGKIGGDITLTTRADNIINVAAGSNATACQSINSMGEPNCP